MAPTQKRVFARSSYFLHSVHVEDFVRCTSCIRLFRTTKRLHWYLCPLEVFKNLMDHSSGYLYWTCKYSLTFRRSIEAFRRNYTCYTFQILRNCTWSLTGFFVKGERSIIARLPENYCSTASVCQMLINIKRQSTRAPGGGGKVAPRAYIKS